MKQYSMRIAAIHWLTLLLIIAAYYFGHALDEAEVAAAKMSLFPVHFVLGSLVLLLTLIRAFFLRKDGQPEPIPGSTEKANKLAATIKHLLYTLLLLVPISGLVLFFSSGVVDALRANNPSLLPDMEKIFMHEVHGSIVIALLLVVGLHALAALQHQFILKDNILRRIMIKRIKD